MTAGWRPDTPVQVAFNTDPNQPRAVRVYNDLTVRYRKGQQYVTGRQYELNETQAGAPAMTLQDTDEYLNPANEDSPYWPNVDTYRPILQQAIWPNDGTVVNYLNDGAPVPGMQQVFYDPTFESYEPAATVPWITAVPAVEGPEPVVGTTTPHTGTQDLTYSVVSGGGIPWGVSWPVPCVPGREYTCSAYVRQSSASTQSIRVTDQSTVSDDFNRTTASGWGTATFAGGAWTIVGAGSAASYFTTPAAEPQPWYGTASQSNAAVGTRYITGIGSSIVDSDQLVLVTVPVLATGGEIVARLFSRMADTNNHYFMAAGFQTDSTIDVTVQKRVAGTATVLDSATLSFTYEAGSRIWIRMQNIGELLQAKLWLDGTVEPSEWPVSVLDTVYTAGGQIGCGSTLNGSNTNTLPVVFVFQRYGATCSVVGSSTATTGSYVRLSVTWTASRPIHTIQLATLPTATVNGTALIDDIQHEQGASATTFVDTGPVIYGLFDGYVERWPAQWQLDSQGFEGIADIITVDGFGPLNKTTLLAAYPQACVSLNPTHYWRLSEPDGASAYGDLAVAGSVPLVNLESKFGAGTPPAAAPNAVPGDPQATGVAFTPSAAPDTFTQAVTILGNGAGTTPGVLVPAVIGSGWAMTLAVWVIGQPTDPVAAVTLASFYRPLAPGVGYVEPIAITVNSSGNANAHLSNYVAPNPFVASVSSGTPVLDGLPHLIVATVEQNMGGTNTVVSIFVDGVFKAATTVTTASVGGIIAAQATITNVGGLYDGVTAGAVCDATVSHVAVWNRALSGTEIVSVLGGPTLAAGGGWSGEYSGQRVRRYLTGELASVAWTIAGAYNGGAVSIDTGMSVMGVDDLVSGTDALTACQSVATTENGMFFAGPTCLCFSGRARRYLQTESLYTFGENTAGGEIPYTSDFGFDWDPTLVYNPVVVTNSDGIIATAVNPGALLRYFGQTLARQINVLDDNEAVDAADYLLAQHYRPKMRVANLRIDPASNPDIWAVALRSQLNDRVTVVRRAKAANSGAGIVTSSDFFVELKSHDAIDMEGEWQLSFQLSPVDASQVWILEDAVYGILDQTTIPGY